MTIIALGSIAILLSVVSVVLFRQHMKNRQQRLKGFERRSEPNIRLIG